jgi:hypothetical protein
VEIQIWRSESGLSAASPARVKHSSDELEECESRQDMRGLSYDCERENGKCGGVCCCDEREREIELFIDLVQLALGSGTCWSDGHCFLAGYWEHVRDVVWVLRDLVTIALGCRRNQRKSNDWTSAVDLTSSGRQSDQNRISPDYVELNWAVGTRWWGWCRRHVISYENDSSS